MGARGSGFEKPDFGDANGAGAFAQVPGCWGDWGVGVGSDGAGGSAPVPGEGRVVMFCHSLLEAAGECVGVSLRLLQCLRRLLGTPCLLRR